MWDDYYLHPVVCLTLHSGQGGSQWVDRVCYQTSPPLTTTSLVLCTGTWHRRACTVLQGACCRLLGCSQSLPAAALFSFKLSNGTSWQGFKVLRHTVQIHTVGGSEMSLTYLPRWHCSRHSSSSGHVHTNTAISVTTQPGDGPTEFSRSLSLEWEVASKFLLQLDL